MPPVCARPKGCSVVSRVDIVKNGLKAKSCWWRKCPLEVSHPSRKLLGGETSFLLFAAGGAAKEQWYTALSRAIAAGGAAASVESMYLSFCRYLYSSRPETYPKVRKCPCDLHRVAMLPALQEWVRDREGEGVRVVSCVCVVWEGRVSEGGRMDMRGM